MDWKSCRAVHRLVAFHRYFINTDDIFSYVHRVNYVSTIVWIGVALSARIEITMHLYSAPIFVRSVSYTLFLLSRFFPCVFSVHMFVFPSLTYPFPLLSCYRSLSSRDIRYSARDFRRNFDAVRFMRVCRIVFSYSNHLGKLVLCRRFVRECRIEIQSIVSGINITCAGASPKMLG